MIDEARRAFDKLDILVNNAGVGRFGDVEHTTLEDWRALLAVNLDGVFLGIKHAIAPMREAGGGSIVNLSSIEGLVGDPALAAYNAEQGSRSFAHEVSRAVLRERTHGHPRQLGASGLHLDADGTARSRGVRSRRRDAANIESLHPVGHLGEAMDVAYGVLYLASDEAAFVTGAELVIDGGYTAQ